MTEFASRVADVGLTLCYHHHMGTIVQSEADIDAFMENTKAPVNLLLDTGHATWGGSDPAALARRYRDRIRHVHCKDVRKAKMDEANAGDWSFLDSILGKGAELGVYTVPGDGMVDFVEVFQELKGYSGWVILEAEQDPKKAPALPYAKKGVAHLRAAFRRAVWFDAPPSPCEGEGVKRNPPMPSKLLVHPSTFRGRRQAQDHARERGLDLCRLRVPRDRQRRPHFAEDGRRAKSASSCSRARRA